MTDQIQPEPSRLPNHNSADFTDAPDPLVDELRHRLRVLEQEKRRWKLIGITALVALALVIVGGGIVAVGTAARFAFQAKRAEMDAMMQAEQSPNGGDAGTGSDGAGTTPGSASGKGSQTESGAGRQVSLALVKSEHEPEEPEYRPLPLHRQFLPQPVRRVLLQCAGIHP